MLSCAEREAGDCGGRGAGRSGRRGQLRDRGGNTPNERLGLREAMLWFQGAIPAAIASAKKSGAVFVVFVAGEGSGAPRYGWVTPCGLPPTSGVPSLFVHGEAGAASPWHFSAAPVHWAPRAWPPLPASPGTRAEEASSRPRPQSALSSADNSELKTGTRRAGPPPSPRLPAEPLTPQTPP